MTAPRIALLALLLTSAALAAPVPKGLKAKAPSLDGRWEVVQVTIHEKDFTRLNRRLWVIEGERLTIYDREDGRLVLASPETTTTLVRPAVGGVEDVDYILDEGQTRRVFKGIAAVLEGELNICYGDEGNPRPGQMKPGAGLTCLKLKRVTDE